MLTTQQILRNESKHSATHLNRRESSEIIASSNESPNILSDRNSQLESPDDRRSGKNCSNTIEVTLQSAESNEQFKESFGRFKTLFSIH
jgi:hypothetical protein